MTKMAGFGLKHSVLHSRCQVEYGYKYDTFHRVAILKTYEYPVRGPKKIFFLSS